MADNKKFTPYFLRNLPTGENIDPNGLYLIGDKKGFTFYMRDNDNTIWIKQKCCIEDVISDIILPVGKTERNVRLSLTGKNFYLEPVDENKTLDYLIVESDNKSNYKIFVNDNFNLVTTETSEEVAQEYIIVSDNGSEYKISVNTTKNIYPKKI